MLTFAVVGWWMPYVPGRIKQKHTHNKKVAAAAAAAAAATVVVVVAMGMRVATLGMVVGVTDSQT